MIKELIQKIALLIPFVIFMLLLEGGLRTWEHLKPTIKRQPSDDYLENAHVPNTQFRHSKKDFSVSVICITETKNQLSFG